MQFRDVLILAKYATFDYNQGLNFMLHFHDAYEMIYVTGGTAKITIANKQYTLAKNSLVFINGVEKHALRNISHDFSRYFFTFAPSPISKMLDDSKLMSIFTTRPPQFNHVVDVGLFEDEVQRFCASLINETENDDEYSISIMATRLKQLLITLYRHYPEQFMLPTGKRNTELKRVRNYLDTNYAEHITIESLAHKFHFSKYYLSHAFKNLTGFSPKQYLMMIRLSHARDLLISTSMSLEQITEQSGFQDVSNFIRYFKKEMSVTPVKYRNMYDPDDVTD